jgi:putative transposase
MPRQPRLDAPGLLQHVMARGIERRQIFRSDKDRESFLDRLATILEETKTQCYAWSLVPNHFHLLLRTGLTPLSKVMRRLMTGYAVTFNKRHKRSGHLFQNRYKSIVCEEDPYLLELIRYIHLNPLRAKLVQDLKELDKYPWTGHSAILGRRKNPLVPKPPDQPNKPHRPDEPRKSLAERTLEDLLLHFGDTLKVSRRRYRQFIKNGIDQGTRPELEGGGLVRSAGGNKWGLLGRKKEEREKGDDRILGSGDFVLHALNRADELFEGSVKNPISLDELIRKVTQDRNIDLKDLLSYKRTREITDTRAIISYLAAIELKNSGTKIASQLRLSEKSVSRCIERGKKLLDKDENLLDYVH